MSRVWDKWNSWNCEVGYLLRDSVKLRLHIQCRLLFLGLENNGTQFVTSIQGPTRVPSTKKKKGSFESADFFIRIGLVNPHTETAYFWNHYLELIFWIWRVWWICVDHWNRILLKSKKDWTRGDLKKWKLSSWKWRTTMLPALIASLTACVEINFAILTTTIGHFKFIKIVESLSSRRRHVKRLRSGPGCWKAD